MIGYVKTHKLLQPLNFKKLLEQSKKIFFQDYTYTCYMGKIFKLFAALFSFLPSAKTNHVHTDTYENPEVHLSSKLVNVKKIFFQKRRIYNIYRRIHNIYEEGLINPLLFSEK